jgi:hypothetical protein
MKMLRLLFILVMISCLTGSDCETERLESLNNGQMTDDDLILHPMVVPWEVISDDLEQPRGLDEAMEIVNEAFFPTQVLSGGIDVERFDESILDTDGLFGVILLSQGFVGTPEWDEELGFIDDGGIARMEWNEFGEIYFVEIIINSDIAYDRRSVREVLIHEFGHALGLAHDEESLDLGSCMSSPPPYGCELLLSDVELVLESLSNG